MAVILDKTYPKHFLQVSRCFFREKSNPSIRAIKISIANGVQKRIWPIVTGTRPNLKPRLNQIMRIDTANIISGIKKGIIIAPYEIFCPLNLYLAKAFAAKSAIVVLTTLATTPTLILAQSALCKFLFDHISS